MLSFNKGSSIRILFILFTVILLFSVIKIDDHQVQNDLYCSGDYSTAGILVDINEEIYNDDESIDNYSRYSWSSDDFDRILIGNGIPNHEVGIFPNPNNPNTIREQNINKRFTLCPKIITESGLEVVGPALAIAYAINSVKFDPATAGRCNDAGECSLAQGQGNWNI